MDNKIIAEIINVDEKKTEKDILNALRGKMNAVEKAGSYKAQADYWKEQYQSLKNQCVRAMTGRSGLKKLREILEDDIGVLSNY